MRDALLEALDSTIRTMVSGKDVAVAFSGGLDSGVVAVLCKRYARSVRLYTVGVDGSYDVRESEELASALEMDWVHIPIDEGSLIDGLRDTISMTGTIDPIVLSFEVPLMYILPRMEEEVILTGQGADEVFLGYSKYVGLSEDGLMAQLSDDYDKLFNVTRVHETRMADSYGKTVLCPFLEESVRAAVSEVPLDDLMPHGDDRKVPLRDVAVALGHPEIASKPKKAAQYGSGAMNMMKRIAKTRGQTVGALIIGLKDGVERE